MPSFKNLRLSLAEYSTSGCSNQSLDCYSHSSVLLFVCYCSWVFVNIRRVTKSLWLSLYWCVTKCQILFFLKFFGRFLGKKCQCESFYLCIFRVICGVDDDYNFLDLMFLFKKDVFMQKKCKKLLFWGKSWFLFFFIVKIK